MDFARASAAPLVAMAALLASAAPTAAAADAEIPIQVQVVQASGKTSSFFSTRARPGRRTVAGQLVLTNKTRSPIGVSLEAVDGLTAPTLGSAYGGLNSVAHEETKWLEVGRRRVRLLGRQRLPVPVALDVPAGAAPGDYLAGVSVIAATSVSEDAPSSEARVASRHRYAVGVQIVIPGPRNPKIEFTGARIERDPSNLVFLLDAENSGNEILQDVKGRALVTQDDRVVTRLRLGPGTFVSDTKVAIPVAAPSTEQPKEGTRYRVRAFLRYRTGIARLDTGVTFGRTEAKQQQRFSGRPAEGDGGIPPWLWVVIGGAAAGAAIAATRNLRRGRLAPAPTSGLPSRPAGETPPRTSAPAPIRPPAPVAPSPTAAPQPPLVVPPVVPVRHEAERVDINTADEDELSSLPGLGKLAARRLIADREANGRFDAVDDLRRVEGFHAERVERLRPHVRV